MEEKREAGPRGEEEEGESAGAPERREGRVAAIAELAGGKAVGKSEAGSLPSGLVSGVPPSDMGTDISPEKDASRELETAMLE